jgi:hypothetical protein
MTPYQHQVQFINAPRGNEISFAVPGKKGIMLEFLTVSFTLNGNFDAPCIFIGCTLNGARISHFIPLSELDKNNYGVAQLIKLYAEPGSNISVQVSSVDGGTFNGFVTLVGHLIV